MSWFLKSVTSEKSYTDAKTEWGLTNCGQYIYDLSGAPIADGAPLTASNWRKIDTTIDASLNPLVAYWVKGELASGDSGSGDSGSGDSGSTLTELTVNDGNYPGIAESTIVTGVPTNAEVEIVSFTFNSVWTSHSWSNFGFTKYNNQNNVFLLYAHNNNDSGFIKVTFTVTNAGDLTIQHDPGRWKTDTLSTSETASYNYDNQSGTIQEAHSEQGLESYFFTDLVIRYGSGDSGSGDSGSGDSGSGDSGSSNLQPLTDSTIGQAVTDWMAGGATKDTVIATYGSIGAWDTSQVTNMQDLFRDTTFNEDITNWDVSNVTNLSWMFYGNADFSQNITIWNVTTTNLTNMFRRANAMKADYNNVANTPPSSFFNQ